MADGLGDSTLASIRAATFPQDASFSSVQWLWQMMGPHSVIPYAMVYGKSIIFRKASTSALKGAPPMMISMKFPPKTSIAFCLISSFILSLMMGTCNSSLPNLLSTLGRIFFLNIFSTISGTQAMTRGRISANDSAMILGDGMRVRNHRWAPAVKP